MHVLAIDYTVYCSIFMNGMTEHAQGPLHTPPTSPPEAQEPGQSSTQRCIYPSYKDYAIQSMASMYSIMAQLTCHVIVADSMPACGPISKLLLTTILLLQLSTILLLQIGSSEQC